MEEQVRFVIEAAEAESMAKQLGLTKVEELLPTLVRSAQSLARPPISNYQVGAVGLGSSGRIFFGANIEFPGLPLNNSIHAEQFLVINLYLNAEPAMSSMAVSSAPCGHCRQFFQELRSSGSIRILVTDDDHRSREFEDFSTFLPHRFGPDDLLHKDSPLILERHDHKLSLISDSDSESDSEKELKMEALEAANRSHAPYSKCPSGIAMMDREGKVYRGSYMESAAFNPSLGPVQAAMVACIVGGAYEKIVAAILVEKEGALVRQEATARLILATVAPKCELKVFHCRSG